MRLPVIPILAILIFFSHNLFSQEQYNEEITVIAPYQPIIPEAVKLNILPKVIIEEHRIRDIEYSIVPRLISSHFEPQPLKPVKIVGEPITKLYRNLIKVGIGNYKTPYFEFFANNLRSKKHALGVHLKHLSSGEMKNFPGSSQSVNKADIYAKKFFKKSTLDGKILFNRKGVHYYGYDRTYSDVYDVSKDSIKQTYTLIGANVGLEANISDREDLFYKLDLHWHWLFDHYKSSEHNIGFNTKIAKTTKVFNFADEDTFGADLGVEYFRNTDTLFAHNTTLIPFIPFWKTTFNEYSFMIGVNASFVLDTVSVINIAPIVEIKVNIIKDVLSAYVGTSGGVQRSSFKYLSDQNQFITSVIPMDWTKEKIRVYGGITARAGKYVNFNLSVEGRNMENMPFFVNDTSTARNKDLFNQFTVVYDDTKEVHGLAEIIFQKDEKLMVALKGNYYQFSMDKEKEAWQRPDYDVSLSGKYNIQDKFIIGAEVIAFGKYYAKTYENRVVVPVEVEGFVDLNVSLEYRYSKNLSGFINLNNLTNNQYYKWYNYASQRFNFMIGATYAF